MSMKLAEYTTSTYDLTLTSATVNSSSRLEYGTESSYTSTVSSSASGTYWKSIYTDDRYATVSTETNDVVEKRETFDVSYTVNTDVTLTIYDQVEHREAQGKAYQEPRYTATHSYGFTALDESSILYNASTLLTITSSAFYTLESTIYANDIAAKSYITETVMYTTANSTSQWVTVYKTESWSETLKNITSFTDVEKFNYSGVTSQLILSESAITSYFGKSYSNLTHTSTTNTIAEIVSYTPFLLATTKTYVISNIKTTTRKASSVTYWYHRTTYTTLWPEYIVTTTTDPDYDEMHERTVNNSSYSYIWYTEHITGKETISQKILTEIITVNVHSTPLVEKMQLYLGTQTMTSLGGGNFGINFKQEGSTSYYTFSYSIVGAFNDYLKLSTTVTNTRTESSVPEDGKI